MGLIQFFDFDVFQWVDCKGSYRRLWWCRTPSRGGRMQDCSASNVDGVVDGGDDDERSVRELFIMI